MENNIDELRRNSASIVQQVDSIYKLNNNQKKQNNDYKNEYSDNIVNYDKIIDDASERLKTIGNLKEQLAYINSEQFNKDHNLYEIEEKITKKR